MPCYNSLAMGLNLKELSDDQLLHQTKDLAQEERKLTTEVLRHLKEVEARLLHLQVGCHSLFDYCVRELRYSEAAASRRIQAMKILKDVPQTAQAIEDGKLNLSNVSAVQSFLNREAKDNGKIYTFDEKRDLLQSIENKSRRECDQLLATISPASVLPQEKEKPITDSKTQLSIVLDETVVQNLKRIQELLAHQCPSGSYAEVIGKMTEIVLDKIDPNRKAERARHQNRPTLNGPTLKEDLAPSTQTSPPPAETAASLIHSERPIRREPILARVKHEVWRRDQGRCTFKDATGRRCMNRFRLQMDHFPRPVCLGGKSVTSNLRLLCYPHHKYESLRMLGPSTMNRYYFKSAL
jgi:hypothetical protein